MSHFPLRRNLVPVLALLPLLAAYACVDAPSAPDGFSAPGVLVIAPRFAPIDRAGPAAAAAQASPLDAAFDRVNRFHLVARRQSAEIALDTIIVVTPGQNVYDLSVNITVKSPDELFLVTLTALEDDTELFKSEAIPIHAVSGDQPNQQATPVDIPLTYSGPGAYASKVELDPADVILGSGGTLQVGAKVLNSQDVVLADVPLVWSSDAESIATVSATGSVSGVATGVTQIRATTPTGLQDSARVYVVDGTLAYVQGGKVMVRAAAGGDATERSSGSAARGPAWTADGGAIYYSEGGQVTKAGGSALFEGSWPTPSPDGTKVAAERSGQVWFANDDGTNPTQGPAGTTPIWNADRTLVVGGGSIEQVGVDGSGRSTLVSGDATMPALGPGGAVAYVQGGSLKISTGGSLADGVTGRPSWSTDGKFLAVPGASGLMLVPADGSAPPVALPGLDGATDPAWQPSGSLTPAAGLSVTGLDPDPPIPGQSVTVMGSGFDDLITANNHVFWPTSEGSTETTVTSTSATGLKTVMPIDVVKGQIRVVRYKTEATLDFVPTFGALIVHARTPWDAAVPGVDVTITNGSGSEVAKGSTDDSGNYAAGALLPGTYTVTIGPPAYFDLDGAATRSVDVTSANTTTLALSLTPHVVKGDLSPASISMGVYDEVPASIRALDVNGNSIPTVTTATWTSQTGRLTIRGSGLSVTLVGASPSTTSGDATFSVTLGGETFSFGATVTSSISGTVTDEKGDPVPSVTVILKNAVSEVASTETDAAGHYIFRGLYAGTYSVGPKAPAGKAASPTSQSVTLGAASPVGTANFMLVASAGGGRRAGDIVIYKDYDPWYGPRVETTLNGLPFDFTKGTDYFVRPTSDLLTPIPASTSIIILTSLSSSSSPLVNVNSPTAQANLDAWVKGGGWLLVHMADNVSGDGYMVPGLSGKADDNLNCTGLTLTETDNAFIRGPDGVLGTADDLTQTNIDNNGIYCYDNHGSLAGILPAGADVMMEEQGGLQRGVYATYPYGAGRIVVTTLTLEFGSHPQQTLTNHLWWTIMSGGGAAGAPPAAVMAPAPSRALLGGGDKPLTTSGAVAAPVAYTRKPGRAGGGSGPPKR